MILKKIEDDTHLFFRGQNLRPKFWPPKYQNFTKGHKIKNVALVILNLGLKNFFDPFINMEVTGS